MSTNLKITIWVLVFAVLIVAAAIILGQQGKQPKEIGLTPTAAVPQTTRWKSYREFVSSGSSEVCNFSRIVDGSTISGTVYASNGKIRGDFNVNGSTGTLQQHLIVDALTVYLWTNLDNQGLKFALTESTNAGLTQNFGADSQYNYTCGDWPANLSVFDIPGNIVFTEINETTLPALLPKNSSTNSTVAQCRICDSLTDDAAKASCRTQYVCAK